MLFIQRFYTIIKRAKHTPVQLWVRSILFGMMSVSASFVYLVSANAQTINMHTLNQAFANAGMIMIGLSFILSGVCYFWDFFDTKIIYRKYIGLVGFWLIVAHGIVTLMLPQFPLFGFFTSDNIVAFLAAVFSLLILVMMAMISNRYVIRELGGKRWRALLRTGYIAYVLGAFHMAMKKYPLWSAWVDQLSFSMTFPPLSLIIFIFVSIVMSMRFALTCALIIDSKQRK